MLSIDYRAWKVTTTVALFAIGAVIVYLARYAFLALMLSLLFAYLIEPTVTLIQKRSRIGHGNRTWAIVQVYLVGLVLVGVLGYEFAPRIVEQIRNLNAALPQILQGVSDGKAAAYLEVRRGLSASQLQSIYKWLARNHDFIAGISERGVTSVVSMAAGTIWIFAIPILAIFILRDGRQLASTAVQAVAPLHDRNRIKGIADQVDAMLAKYIRAQLAMAGLSFVFYSTAMLALKFPYAIAIGALGGVLEFLPMVGWIASAGAILAIGFMTHAHWIWMAGLLLLWRLILDYVISPRIMGNSLQLQPLTVIFALMVGGQVGGIAGLYLSVPVVAVLRIICLGTTSSRSSPETLPDQSLVQMNA
jgi:predicted PurR-regulated permease PerM